MKAIERLRGAGAYRRSVKGGGGGREFSQGWDGVQGEMNFQTISFKFAEPLSTGLGQRGGG